MFTKISLAWIFALCWNPPAGAQESTDGWRLALPGWHYQFPADHAVHQNFKTEWWYFTGNLTDDSGRDYGYELTFFRQGLIAPASSSAPGGDVAGRERSRFVQKDFKFAHFAISDLHNGRFIFTQKLSRGAFGEAGFGADPGAAAVNAEPERLAWMESWSLQPQANGSWRIAAQATDTSPKIAIDLTLDPQKPPVIEGTDGVSQKSAGVGNASHYYSYTRLKTAGTLKIGDDANSHHVSGESWFDHEWASNQLASDQIGWNWFCFQFDDQTELMLYAMRKRDGSIDAASSGTLIHADGTSEYLARSEFDLQPLKTWHSLSTSAIYPIEWRIKIPSRQLDFTVNARLDDQELVLPAISYWEGAIQASGQRAGRPLRGQGYMELTGYANALTGLQRSEPQSGLQAPTH